PSSTSLASTRPPLSLYSPFTSLMTNYLFSLFFFFFTDTPTTATYTLSLHDALPISYLASALVLLVPPIVLAYGVTELHTESPIGDRKSTRLNSSHGSISYAVFCLKKKKIQNTTEPKAPTTHTANRVLIYTEHTSHDH